MRQRCGNHNARAGGIEHWRAVGCGKSGVIASAEQIRPAGSGEKRVSSGTSNKVGACPRVKGQPVRAARDKVIISVYQSSGPLRSWPTKLGEWTAGLKGCSQG